MHVHLHWLCIPTHFNLLFFLDQSATPATPVTFSNTRLSSSFHLPSLLPIFLETQSTRNSLALVAFSFFSLLSSIPLRIYSCSIETCSSICLSFNRVVRSIEKNKTQRGRKKRIWQRLACRVIYLLRFLVKGNILRRMMGDLGEFRGSRIVYEKCNKLILNKQLETNRRSKLLANRRNEYRVFVLRFATCLSVTRVPCGLASLNSLHHAHRLRVSSSQPS